MANQIDTDIKVRGESAFGFGQNKILQVSSGRLYTAFLNDVDDVEIHYSDNNGTSWNLDITFSESTAYFISMCKSPDGDVFVCYQIGTGISYTSKVKKRDYSTGVWSEVDNQGFTVKNSGEKVYGMVTWSQNIARLYHIILYHDSDNNSYERVRYSDNKGSSWNQNSHSWITSTGNLGLRLLGTDTVPSTGKLYILWGDSIVDRIRLFRYTIDGGYEAEEWGINDEPNGGGFLVDGNGNRWIVYQSDISGLGFYVYKNGSQQLSISNGHYCKYGMEVLGEDGSNNIYLIYTKNSDNKLYKRASNESNFVTETALTTIEALRPSCQQHVLGSASVLNYVFSSNV